MVQKNGKDIYYYKETYTYDGSSATKSFYILKSYEVAAWEEQVSKDPTDGKKIIAVTKIRGGAENSDALANLQHKSFWLKDENDSFVMTALGESLTDIHLSSYGAVTNAGGYKVPKVCK